MELPTAPSQLVHCNYNQQITPLSLGFDITTIHNEDMDLVWVEMDEVDDPASNFAKTLLDETNMHP